MNEDFVTYEIAKKLKEKGFREKCLYHYNNNDILKENYSKCYCSANSIFTDNTVDAPTTAQALKWLIKERGIFVEISPAYIDITYYVSVYKNKNGRYFKHYISELKYKSYEQAAIAGIEYVLDNIIKE